MVAFIAAFTGLTTIQVIGILCAVIVTALPGGILIFKSYKMRPKRKTAE